MAACSGNSPTTNAKSSTSTTTASTTPATNSPGSSGTAQAPSRPTIAWHQCGTNQCGTLQVPVDYSKPNGATLRLAFVKIAARDQSSDDGPLLVDPGGPGASGIQLATVNPWPAAIRDHFDIIGFDPRGVGQSSALNCGIPPERLYHVDYVPDTPAETQQLLGVSTRYVDDCQAHYGSVLPHLGTRDVARDMDSIRRGLGVGKINYLGYSYGTAIGQEYADLFPTHIRAMVLDGVVDVAEPGIRNAQAQGRSFEHLLDLFDQWCQQTSTCAIQNNPSGVLKSVYDKTQHGTIPAPRADRPLGPGEFQLGVIDPLYQGQSGYPRLAAALAQADAGDGTALVALADEYLGGDGFEIYFAVSCLDFAWPHNPQAIIDAGKAIAPSAPIVGEATVTDYVRCGLWPTPPQPLTAPRAIGSPPILVVSTTNDPATPYRNGVQLVHQLPHGVLLTHDGEGHTIYAQGDQCIDRAVDSYLVSLQSPPNGSRCD